MDAYITKQLGADILEDEKEEDEELPDKCTHSKLLEWNYFRQECDNLGLEELFQAYILRMQRSFLSIYFVVQTFISIIHVIILVSTDSGGEPQSPDFFFYTFSILVIWIALFPAFKEDLVKQHPWIPYICSNIAILTLLLSDIGIPIYHDIIYEQDPPLRPMYASHILLIIYMFLPIKSNSIAILIGITLTICYTVIYYFISFQYDDDRVMKIFSELIFLACMNFLGFHFRLMSEIDIRRTFLDRRECVQENLSLKFERNQEKALLLSILPAHIAEKMETDFQIMIKKMRSERRSTFYHILNPKWLGALPENPQMNRPFGPMKKLYVETHDNVSILYADVVNFTNITTRLPVRTLVETLHELFVKFDEASEEFNVLRIKFLGDCYYCVSGLPITCDDHAKNCVDLGLRMIRDIRSLRRRRNLNIDMRIGVHSGTVIGGVMGALKWQYDVWSEDVLIANKLESTGVPGKVHITKQTLNLIDEEYTITAGTEDARSDPFLKEHGIETFLISPEYEDLYEIKDTCTCYDPSRFSRKRNSVRKRSTWSTPERRNFMQNSMEQFTEIMKQTNIEMENELKNMPIGRFRLNKLFSPKEYQQDGRTAYELEEAYKGNRKTSKLSPIFMCFNDKKLEWSFQHEPDILLKYSVLMSFIVLLTVIGIQVLNKSTGRLFFWVICFSASVLFSIIPIIWFKKFWDMYCPILEACSLRDQLPKFKLIRIVYDISYKITKNVILRTSIYLVVVLLLVLCSLVHLVECSQEYSKINGTLSNINIEVDEEHFSICLNSWSVTQSLVLVICASFLFLRIHFLLKFGVAIFVNILYFYIVFFWVNDIYDASPSTNPALDSKIAHFLKIAVTTGIFHMIDRQTEYIQRVDFNWKQQLESQKSEAEVTKMTNKILVHNILPVHVAEIYLNRQLRYEFYNEEYDDVAVCFASIKNFKSSCENPQTVLKVLNEIICNFDETLMSFSGYQKIEKIKVIGWTYMVACGLDPGRNDSSCSSGGLQDGRRSFNTSIYTNSLGKRHQRKHKTSVRQSNSVVVALTEFSLELMRVLQKFNEENFYDSYPLKLRVGISHGKVMAGVVGSSKPLYDVWGNAVNMASRMDSTNVPGKIQVTEDSANILTSYGYVCEYRGKTFVKGRGTIPTYFVSIDDHLQFVKNQHYSQHQNYFETVL